MKIQKTSLLNYPVCRKNFTSAHVAKKQNADTFSYSKKEKQKIPLNLYFVRMKCYGKNLFWANSMKELTANIAQMIKSKSDFDEIMKEIEETVAKINKEDNFGKKRNEKGFYKVCSYSRGCEYYFRYNKKFNENYEAKNNDVVFRPKSNKIYENANLCKIYYDDWGEDFGYSIEYGYREENKISNLDLVKKEYEELISMKNPSKEAINKSCATIQWLIIQECPYIRGNDSIANILTKSTYLACNILPPRVKKGYGLDFEAFSSNLDDYIKNYPSFFE